MEYLLKMMLQYCSYLKCISGKFMYLSQMTFNLGCILYEYVHEAIQKKYFHHILTFNENDSQNGKNLNQSF